MGLKQFVALFVLVIFMAQTFSNAIIVADYYINTASFAVKCENKNKPQMHCNGQCQMIKQLEKEENGNKPFSNTSKEKNELQVYCCEEPATNIYLSVTLNSAQNNFFHFCMQQCLRTFFHPPSVV